MNITISVDDALLERARRYAAARGSSVQQLLREQLERLVGAVDRNTAADELVRLFREHPGRSESGYTFRRDDAYEERLE